MTVINLRTFSVHLTFLHIQMHLKVVRVESGVTNATANGAGLLIRDDDHYDNDFDNGQASVGEWTARTAGTHGNAIGVSICASATAYEQSAVTTTSATRSKRSNNNICNRRISV